MAARAAWQMCSGVGKSGSPRLKSKTWTPSAFSWRALASAANVAEGWMDAAILETGIGSLLFDMIQISPKQNAPAAGRGNRLDGHWEFIVVGWIEGSEGLSVEER